MTTTQNADSQATLSPQAALQMLKDGNRRFLNGENENRDFLKQVKATRAGQWPFAVVLSCIDSRIPSEIVFDAGIGDIFSARVAGNFVNADILGSMEFACELAGAKLVVVMGHTNCGAVKGACDHVELGNLTATLANLAPALETVTEPADEAQRNSGNEKFVTSVARKNVELTMKAIRQRSSVLRKLEEAGAIQVVGAMYHVEGGNVEFL